MHLYMPTVILVPDTAGFLAATDSNANAQQPSELVQYIQDEFPGTLIEPMARKAWNDVAGLEFISQLCVEDEERAGTIVAVSSQYYALSAACALFKYSELRLNLRFAAGSLRIHFRAAEGTMFIDPETIRNLEIIGNMTARKSNHSLFGTLNHTYTAMGARLLRISLLSPLTGTFNVE